MPVNKMTVKKKADSVGVQSPLAIFLETHPELTPEEMEQARQYYTKNELDLFKSQVSGAKMKIEKKWEPFPSPLETGGEYEAIDLIAKGFDPNKISLYDTTSVEMMRQMNVAFNKKKYKKAYNNIHNTTDRLYELRRRGYISDQELNEGVAKLKLYKAQADQVRRNRP